MNKKQYSQDLIMNSWIDEFAKFMALESLNLVRACGKPKGGSVIKALSTRFLRFYIEQLVSQSLTEYTSKGLTGEEAYDFTSENLAVLKTDVQNEVAGAFEAAFKTYTGKPVDYYCLIRPVPEAINKEMC